MQFSSSTSLTLCTAEQEEQEELTLAGLNDVLREQGPLPVSFHVSLRVQDFHNYDPAGERLRMMEEENRRLHENLQQCMEEVMRFSQNRTVSLRIVARLLQLIGYRATIALCASSPRSSGHSTSSLRVRLQSKRQ